VTLTDVGRNTRRLRAYQHVGISVPRRRLKQCSASEVALRVEFAQRRVILNFNTSLIRSNVASVIDCFPPLNRLSNGLLG
jgi:hypothetical protein